MVDKLYIGDIPNTFHYAVYNNDYITLYDKQPRANTSYTYYRIYDYDSLGFHYVAGTGTYGNYVSSTYDDIPVSNSWLYRGDVDKIFNMIFIIIFGIIFLTNLMTSAFKRGGALGGLL